MKSPRAWQGQSDHTVITDAGWSYRTNAERGWIIYRDPETGEWRTREDAVRIVRERVAHRVSLPE